MFNILILATSFALPTKMLSHAEFDAILDEFSADLASSIDDAFFNSPPESVADFAAGAVSEGLVPRLLPIATALSAAASGKSREEMKAVGILACVGTAVQVVAQRFPGDNFSASLEAAVGHLVARVGLQAAATTFGQRKQ
ncbi:hypothetical protein [Rhizobium sp. RU20A]|uniref:hypothetical protein n=1 Tax=Rhizobium sp. RU20A TaxID=1907412 RepID=UPI00122D10A1|nr:hypothetical protein [Rhizobium sp. RU20A]